MMLCLKYREKVLDFFRKYALKIVGVILSILILVVSLYALFCTVYSDVIVQNNNEFIKLPEKSLTEKEIETTFKKLIGTENKSRNLHVFVLDISGSIKKGIKLGEDVYINYRDGIKSVNDKFGGGIINLKKRETMDVFDFVKSRLYRLLLALLQKNKDECNSEFAIWTIGDEAVKKYPDGRKVGVTENSIKDAIKRIDAPINKGEYNTNFVSLFYRLKKVYERELEQNKRDPYESPNFIITILSDLIHDVKNSYNSRSRELKENWNELKEEIKAICNSRIMANMMVISEKNPDIQKTIFSLFKDNIEWYRLNKFLIEEKRQKTFLFTVRTTKKNIIFYYENPNFISQSKFTIRYSQNKANKIRIDIPSKADSVSSQKIIISCRKINAKNEPLGDEQNIITGGSEYEVNLGKNQKIRLTFNGRLPESIYSPILRISLDNEGKTYLIPIDFIKRLPDWASRIFIALKVIFSWVSRIGVFLIVAGLITFFFFKFGIRDQKSEKSEEIEENALPVQKSLEVEEEGTISEPDISPTDQFTEEDFVNINSASNNELKKLPGISAKRAKKIRENRPYEKIDDLKEVLGKDSYRVIKDRICV